MRTVHVLASIAALITTTGSPVARVPQCLAPPTMTGMWKSNDGGTYFVREVGTDVWWVGMSGDGGKKWTNVFKGVRSGAVVTGTWADVPRGKAKSGGTLTLRVDGSGGVTGFSRKAATGGFAGSRWGQSCNDTAQNPGS